MNLVKYTLNVDGTIPDHIEYGGYFLNPNSNASPQDDTMICISSNTSDFSNKSEFLTYVKSFRSDHTDVDGKIKTVISEIDPHNVGTRTEIPSKNFASLTTLAVAVAAPVEVGIKL